MSLSCKQEINNLKSGQLQHKALVKTLSFQKIINNIINILDTAACKHNIMVVSILTGPCFPRRQLYTIKIQFAMHVLHWQLYIPVYLCSEIQYTLHTNMDKRASTMKKNV